MFGSFLKKKNAKCIPTDSYKNKIDFKYSNELTVLRGWPSCQTRPLRCIRSDYCWDHYKHDQVVNINNYRSFEIGKLVLCKTKQYSIVSQFIWNAHRIFKCRNFPISLRRSSFILLSSKSLQKINEKLTILLRYYKYNIMNENYETTIRFGTGDILKFTSNE